MAKKIKVILVAIAIMMSAMNELAAADVAVSFSDWSDIAWPVAGSNHGWKFTVSGEITLTHLGLYDRGANGFEIDHPIGLWRLSDSALLASGTMSAGTVDTALNDFRYIDVLDVDLSVGVDYVIGYYSDSGLADRNILKADDLQVNPAIDIVVRRWDIAGQFQMPANVYEWDPYGGEPYAPDCFGPNFQFIPEPGTILLLSLGCLFLRHRK